MQEAAGWNGKDRMHGNCQPPHHLVSQPLHATAAAAAMSRLKAACVVAAFLLSAIKCGMRRISCGQCCRCNESTAVLAPAAGARQACSCQVYRSSSPGVPHPTSVLQLALWAQVADLPATCRAGLATSPRRWPAAHCHLPCVSVLPSLHVMLDHVPPPQLQQQQACMLQLPVKQVAKTLRLAMYCGMHSR